MKSGPMGGTKILFCALFAVKGGKVSPFPGGVCPGDRGESTACVYYPGLFCKLYFSDSKNVFFRSCEMYFERCLVSQVTGRGKGEYGLCLLSGIGQTIQLLTFDDIMASFVQGTIHLYGVGRNNLWERSKIYMDVILQRTAGMS